MTYCSVSTLCMCNSAGVWRFCFIVKEIYYRDVTTFCDISCQLTQAVFIGMMISSSLWGNISDKYGRKTVSMFSVSEKYFVYSSLQIADKNNLQLVDKGIRLLLVHDNCPSAPEQGTKITILYILKCILEDIMCRTVK